VQKQPVPKCSTRRIRSTALRTTRPLTWRGADTHEKHVRKKNSLLKFKQEKKIYTEWERKCKASG